MQGGLQDGDAVVLEHVQQRCLSCIVETEEEELGVLVCEAERGQDFPDCVLCQFLAGTSWAMLLSCRRAIVSNDDNDRVCAL